MREVKGRLVRNWMLSASAVIGLAGVAHAQEVAPAGEVAPAQPPTQDAAEPVSPQGDEIVVTGYRRSI